MNKKITTCLLLLFASLASVHLVAQAPCAFDQLRQDLIENDADFLERLNTNEKKVREYLLNESATNRSNITYTIPVVVHVVYADNAAPHNISDAQIESAIQRLNDIFSNSSGNSINTNIEFCLASTDPYCNPTNGINRVNGSVVSKYAQQGIDIESVDSDGKGARRVDVLNLSRWNPQEYLNIWVVNEISDNNGGSGIQAFATLPGTSYFYDGVVVLYNAFGYDYESCNCFQLKSYTSDNKVLTHEIGHYLGLYHTFEGDGGGASCPENTETAGDRVTDTPSHIRTFTCASGQNNCYPGNHEYSDWDKVIHNFMGYAPQVCQHEFTQGQVSRMRAFLETTRLPLIHSHGCPEAAPVTGPATECKPGTQTGTSSEYGMGITQVKMNQQVFGSGSTYQDGGYREHLCTPIRLEPQSSYTLEVKTFGFYNEDIRAFIDYDNDGALESDELVLSSNNNDQHTGTFTTPSDVPTDTPLRMRIISDHAQYTINGSCYQPVYGQVEDYMVVFPGIQTELYERGLAMYLDGEDDFLISNVSPEVADGNYTIEFWCKPEGNPGDCQILFDKTTNNFSSLHFMAIWYGRVFIYQGRDLLFLAPGIEITYNEWQHLAYSWDGTVQKFYRNGVLAGIDTVDQVLDNNASFRMGSFFGTYFFFKGQIDECRIWQEVRSGTQIRENMFLASQSTTAPVIYFNFNQTANDSTVQDLSSSYTISKHGGALLIPSSVNSGYNGTQKTLSGISQPGLYPFQPAQLSIEFTEKNGTSDVTITKPDFLPNTLEGIQASGYFSQQTWMVTQSTEDSFTGNFSFFYPEHTFSDLDPLNYSLYYRSVGSDSEWSLINPEADQMDHNSITFNGISSTGQFIVVKK